jgi:hypothetical protein
MAVPHFIRPRARMARESWTEHAPHVAGVIAAAWTFALALLAPPALVLPLLSLALIAVALLLAACTARATSERASASWYVSAALAFIGFGATFLSEPEQVLLLLEGGRREP